jgi:hypothetical protein
MRQRFSRAMARQLEGASALKQPPRKNWRNDFSATIPVERKNAVLRQFL